MKRHLASVVNKLKTNLCKNVYFNSLVAKKIRWCTVSDPEQRKCAELAKSLVTVLPPAAVTAFARLSCVRASSTTDCIDRIRVSLPKNSGNVFFVMDKSVACVFHHLGIFLNFYH